MPGPHPMTVELVKAPGLSPLTGSPVSGAKGFWVPHPQLPPDDDVCSVEQGHDLSFLTGFSDKEMEFSVKLCYFACLKHLIGLIKSSEHPTAREHHQRAASESIIREHHQRASSKSSSREQHQRAAAESIIKEQQQRASSESSSREQQQRAASESIIREHHQRAAAENISREQQQRTSAESSSREQQQRAAAALLLKQRPQKGIGMTSSAKSCSSEAKSRPQSHPYPING
ncbi:hypothetical protein STEG23_000520 [Scotinomys teguina]